MQYKEIIDDLCSGPRRSRHKKNNRLFMHNRVSAIQQGALLDTILGWSDYNDCSLFEEDTSWEVYALRCGMSLIENYTSTERYDCVLLEWAIYMKERP